MAPVMEGTHTVLLLYAPIREQSNISLYFPKRRAPSFHYESRAPHAERPANDRDSGKDDLAASEQRGQSSCSSGRILDSQRATKEAVAELCWLAAEHHQLLADLLSLCKACASNIGMGNQDGKLQGYMEVQEVHPGGQVLESGNSSPMVPPEQKRAVSKGKKLKKLGGTKLDSAEDLLHSKMKKKLITEKSSLEHPPPDSSCTATAMEQIHRIAPSIHASDSPATGSYVSAVSNPILPMEEPFQIARDFEDFEDNRVFDSDMDFCNDFSEYDGELGYESSFCSLMEGLTRRESGSNLRPIKRFDSPVETSSEDASTATSAQRQDSAVIKVVAKMQDVEGTVQRVSHTSPDREEPVVARRPSGSTGCHQDFGKWRGTNGNHSAAVKRENAVNKPSEGLRLPLSHTTEPYPLTKSRKKSPTSPSLAGLFNASFPASNSLQSMSPVLSPLSPKQQSPQLNHRIVLLSDRDVDQEQDSSSNADEPKVFTEVIDKNGNKRTITRLDLNLSRWPSTCSKWNSSSNSTTTGELCCADSCTKLFHLPAPADTGTFINSQRETPARKCLISRCWISKS